MSKTEYVRARIQPEIKDQAGAILSELGLSMSEAISLYMNQIVKHRGIPFPVKLPNDELLASFQQKENGELEEIDNFEAYTESLIMEADEERKANQ